ncbi:MAG: histidine phosphatase family protein [Geminicoccaceae bacterium]
MTSNRTIYLIRHGETEWNLQKRLQGGKDSPLTERGRKQAEAVAKSLKQDPPVLLFASPLDRAKKTAKTIAKGYGIDVRTDDRLAELRCGQAEGMTFADIDERWPDLRERRERDKWRVPWPEGESYRDVDERLTAFLNETFLPLLHDEGAGPWGVVGHETMNMILLGRFLDLDPSMVTKLGQPNHVIYRLEGRTIEHAYLGDNYLEWLPGAVQKRSGDVILLNVA